jgi:tRNA (guanine9-N1)-methyltransferase
MESRPNEKIEENIEIVKPISKNQMKKIKRQEQWESKKEKIKERNKMKKKEKKKTKQLLNEDKETEKKIDLLPRKEWEELFINKVKNGIKIIIDCGFEELMNEKDIISMSRQITQCYSTNRKSKTPFNLIIYDIGEKLLEHLQKNNHENWLGMKYINKGQYKSIKEFLQVNNIIINEDFKDSDILYLTADSENEINTLLPSQTYIIGGIVDRNKHKLLTLNKANEIGISHGRLPIGEFLKLNSSKVLATNHVFQILSYFQNEKSDWKEAFISIIPKRKIDSKTD